MVEINESTTEELVSGQYRSRDVVRDAIQKLTRNLNRECIVMSPTLDQYFFNNIDFIEALTIFTTSHPRNIFKFLIDNSAQVIRDNGRLITLCRRLSENLHIRSLPEEYRGHAYLVIVADRQTLLLQPNISKPEITVTVANKTIAAPYLRRFDYAWQRSEPMPGLHTFGL